MRVQSRTIRQREHGIIWGGIPLCQARMRPKIELGIALEIHYLATMADGGRRTIVIAFVLSLRL